MCTIKIGFTGDFSFSEYTQYLYKSPENVDKKIYDFLNRNDYNVINFESPITRSAITKKNVLSKKSDPKSVTYVGKNIKNPIFNLANNHVMDYGINGLFDTLKKLDKSNIKYIGAGKNSDKATDYIILGDLVKVGILSFQYKDYLVSTNDTPGTAHKSHKRLIKAKIRKLKSLVDWVVVIYHGGEEFTNTPMPYTRRYYKKILKMGADILVCHHPHTVQGYEYFGKKMVFYSLGNFIFDTNYQRTQEGTEYGELISISFSKNNYKFENINVYNNREDNSISTIKSNVYFRNIKRTYHNDWKLQALKFKRINESKKDFIEYYKKYMVNNLDIKKPKKQRIISFNDLIDKNYFEGISDKIIFNHTSFISKRVKRINFKFKKIFSNNKIERKFCILYSKLFKPRERGICQKK